MSNLVVEQLTHSQRVRLLYKTILRIHRGLPDELKNIGDKYAKDEFRRHMKCSPKESHLFITEWAKYATTLSKQLGLRGKSHGKLGVDLDANTVEMLSDDQVVQLYELMLAANNLDDSNILTNSDATIK